MVADVCDASRKVKKAGQKRSGLYFDSDFNAEGRRGDNQSVFSFYGLMVIVLSFISYSKPATANGTKYQISLIESHTTTNIGEVKTEVSTGKQGGQQRQTAIYLSKSWVWYRDHRLVNSTSGDSGSCPSDSARTQSDCESDKKSHFQGLPADQSPTISTSPSLTFQYLQDSSGRLNTLSPLTVDMAGNIPSLSSHSIEYTSRKSSTAMSTSEQDYFLDDTSHEPNGTLFHNFSMSDDDDGYHSLEPQTTLNENQTPKVFYIDIWLLSQYAEQVVEVIRAGGTIYLATPFAGNGPLRIGIDQAATTPWRNNSFSFIFLSAVTETTGVRLERDAQGHLISATFSVIDDCGGTQTDENRLVEIQVLRQPDAEPSVEEEEPIDSGYDSANTPTPQYEYESESHESAEHLLHSNTNTTDDPAEGDALYLLHPGQNPPTPGRSIDFSSPRSLE